MKTYLLKPNLRQVIAKAGETDVAVAFNAKDWLDNYPAGRPQLMVTGPCGERTPVIVAMEGTLITGRIPDELLVGPGMYTYVFAWVSAGTQLQSGRCECLVLDGELARTWACHKPGPDWAERIFIAAESIERAICGVLEARNSAADSLESARQIEADLMSKSVEGYITPERFGAKRDGVTDDTLALQQAIDYAAEHQLLCRLNAGTYLIGGTLFIPSGSVIEGVSQYNTTIRLKNNCHCDMMRTVNYHVLVDNGGSVEADQPHDIMLRKFSLDGNRANQESGSGLLICASRSTIQEVDINNIRDTGMTLGFYQARIDYSHEYATSQGLFLENIRVMTCGQHCIHMYGGNDATLLNVIAADASQDETGTYDILNLTGGGRLVNVHPWSSSASITDKICRYAVNFVNGNYECSACHFEGGGTASVHIATNAHVLMTGCMMYASRGTSIAEIESTMNIMTGCAFSEFYGNVKALTLGSSAKRNVFDCKLLTTTLDEIYFADDSEGGGYNQYRIAYYGSVANTSSEAVVRALQRTSTLMVLPNSSVVKRPMNYMGSLQLRMGFRDAYIYEDPESAPSVKDQDTIFIKSNANNKTLTLEYRYFPPGTEFTVYNLMESSIVIYGAYYAPGADSSTPSITLPARTVLRCMVAYEKSNGYPVLIKTFTEME